MNKHTPGPWVVGNVPSSEGPTIRSERDGIIATASRFGLTETHWANAALIAAAPELYAACLRAIASDQTSDMVRVSILAAIAKAEGRE